MNAMSRETALAPKVACFEICGLNSPLFEASILDKTNPDYLGAWFDYKQAVTVATFLNASCVLLGLPPMFIWANQDLWLAGPNGTLETLVGYSRDGIYFLGGSAFPWWTEAKAGEFVVEAMVGEFTHARFFANLEHAEDALTLAREQELGEIKSIGVRCITAEEV